MTLRTDIKRAPDDRNTDNQRIANPLDANMYSGETSQREEGIKAKPPGFHDSWYQNMVCYSCQCDLQKSCNITRD